MIFFKTLFNKTELSKEIILKTVYQLGMGALGAVLVMLILHLYEPVQKPRIGTVNITGIVDQFIKLQTKQNLPADETKKRVQEFGVVLEKIMHDLSAKQHVVLMPAEAVIVGATDYTPVVQKYLSAAK